MVWVEWAAIGGCRLWRTAAGQLSLSIGDKCEVDKQEVLGLEAG